MNHVHNTNQQVGNHEKYHTGSQSFFFGLALWLIIASVIITLAQTGTFWTIIIYLIALAFAWGDQEIVDMRSIASIENSWTKKPVCNFSEGRHWRRFFTYKVRKVYDNTPNEVKVHIKVRNKEKIFVEFDVSIWPSMVDALAFESTGENDANEYVASELKDYAESLATQKTLVELESQSELSVMTDNIFQQMTKVLENTGLKLLRKKIDIVNLNYDDSIKKSTEKQFIEAAEAKAKQIKLDLFNKRVDKAIIEKLAMYINKTSYSDLIKEAKQELQSEGEANPSEERILEKALAIARAKSKKEILKRGENPSEIETKVKNDVQLFENVVSLKKYEGLDGKNTMASLNLEK